MPMKQIKYAENSECYGGKRYFKSMGIDISWGMGHLDYAIRTKGGCSEKSREHIRITPITSQGNLSSACHIDIPKDRTVIALMITALQEAMREIK